MTAERIVAVALVPMWASCAATFVTVAAVQFAWQRVTR